MSRRSGLGWPVDPSQSVTHPRLGWPQEYADSEEAESERQGSSFNDTTPANDNASRETVRVAGTANEAKPPSDVHVSRETSTTDVANTRVLTVANQKGGVGKTTTTVNVAAALAQAGHRVMVIDLDPQGNASTALGLLHSDGTEGVYEVLIEGKPMVDVVQRAASIDGVWCIPSTMDVAGCEIELVSLEQREFRLRTALRDYALVEHYDYILIDCPPSLGLLTINAFTAATEVLIPIQCEYYALEGLTQLMRNITLIQAHLNPTLRVSTILMTMYDARTRLSAQVASEVRAHFGDLVLKTSVPRSVRISEAPSHGETVLTYDPISVGALSYREVAVELSRQHVPQGAPTST